MQRKYRMRKMNSAWKGSRNAGKERNNLSQALKITKSSLGEYWDKNESGLLRFWNRMDIRNG